MTQIPHLLEDPARARLFAALAQLRRPASTDELAGLVGRHPNSARVQLHRLEAGGLVERRRSPRPLGRPGHEWAIAAAAPPHGTTPHGPAPIGRWLARAIVPTAPNLRAIEDAGREIGREIAPDARGRGVAEAMHDALAALGFAPRTEAAADGGTCFVLGHCPYRDAVHANQPAVCSLHRGITRGLLDRLDSAAHLTEFVARDPDLAGCRIGIATAATRNDPTHSETSSASRRAR